MINEAEMRGFSYIGEPLTTENLEFTFTQFLDWGYLNKGGYYNILLSSSGSNHGGDFSKLRLSDDTRLYSKGQVWEGLRKNWVWESGVVNSYPPIQISGVYVNNTFYPSSTSGTYAHKIDYPNGRIIFNSPISLTASVRCEYSCKKINVYNSKTKLLKYLQTESFRKDKGGFELYGSGNWSLLPEQRLQLPCVIVQAIPSVVQSVPYEIGTYTVDRTQEVFFHIIGEDSQDVTFIHDTIANQCPRDLYTIDKGQMITDQVFPLNYDGSISDSTKVFPELIKHTEQGGYRWKQVTFSDINSVGNNVIDLSYFYNKNILFDYVVIRGRFNLLSP